MLQETIEIYIDALSDKQDGKRVNNRNTIIAYRNDLRQLSVYLLTQGIEQWSEVTHEHICIYLATLQVERDYQPTTIARKLAALKSFFRYIHKEAELVETDPVECISVPRTRKVPPQVLNAEQVSRLFQQLEASTAAGLRDLAMLHVLHSTGLRASELVALNLEDLKLEQRQVSSPVRGSVRRKERALPLSESALVELQRYLEQARPTLARRAGEQALFLNQRGERLTRQGFWLIIKGYARSADITCITPHMLRHSFALLMLQDGVELRTVQEMLGHAHLSTTQIYSQLVQEAQPSNGEPG